MPIYELVASRDFTANEAAIIGTTFPGTPEPWRVIRIEEATDSVFTGEPGEPHVRLICEIASA